MVQLRITCVASSKLCLTLIITHCCSGRFFLFCLSMFLVVLQHGARFFESVPTAVSTLRLDEDCIRCTATTWSLGHACPKIAGDPRLSPRALATLQSVRQDAAPSGRTLQLRTADGPREANDSNIEPSWLIDVPNFKY